MLYWLVFNADQKLFKLEYNTQNISFIEITDTPCLQALTNQPVSNKQRRACHHTCVSVQIAMTYQNSKMNTKKLNLVVKKQRLRLKIQKSKN